MTRLILNCPDTHAGRLDAPGETLEVDLTTADWLIGQGVANPGPQRRRPESSRYLWALTHRRHLLQQRPG